jgi:hypothetical protein
MNTLIVDFEILYLLESPEIIIIEIQRKDMDDRILSSDKFQWLKIDKATHGISPMVFRSMDSSEAIEERFFEEGFLKFGNTNGTYIAKFNSAQHQLLRRSPSDLDELIALALSNYLMKY